MREWHYTVSLSEGFQEKPNIGSKPGIDNSVAKLTNIINKTAKESLGITKTSSYAFFFSIIMKIHITANKYTVNKIWKMKNKKIYVLTYIKQSQYKNIILMTLLEILRLGERK